MQLYGHPDEGAAVEQAHPAESSGQPDREVGSACGIQADKGSLHQRDYQGNCGSLLTPPPYSSPQKNVPSENLGCLSRQNHTLVLQGYNFYFKCVCVSGDHPGVHTCTLVNHRVSDCDEKHPPPHPDEPGPLIIAGHVCGPQSKTSPPPKHFWTSPMFW